jgi:hypothetical protein
VQIGERGQQNTNPPKTDLVQRREAGGNHLLGFGLGGALGFGTLHGWLAGSCERKSASAQVRSGLGAVESAANQGGFGRRRLTCMRGESSRRRRERPDPESRRRGFGGPATRTWLLSSQSGGEAGSVGGRRRHVWMGRKWGCRSDLCVVRV